MFEITDWTRRSFLSIAAPAGVAVLPWRHAAWDGLRAAAARRRRRIIFNNDGDDAIRPETAGQTSAATGDLREAYLGARTSPLLGSQVDAIFYSTCRQGLSFSHRTKVGHFLDRQTFPRCISQDLIERYGRDTLGVQIDFSHRNGLEIFWSLRMNDGHDSYPATSSRGTYGIAPFKRDHPECLFGVPDDFEKFRRVSDRQMWACVDYACPEVREHVFRLVEEVCEGYDIDGVELDFLRRLPLFRHSLDDRPATPEHLEMITALLRRIRRMANDVGRQRGRPILIASRLPIGINLSRFYGLDLRRWLEEGLVDLIVVGHDKSYFSPISSIGAAVELGHKHRVPVYAGFSWDFWSFWAFLDSGYRTGADWQKANEIDWQAIDAWPGMIQAWRGAALNAVEQGADGVYTFNAFDPRHRLFREIGDRDGVAKLDKIYGVDAFHGWKSALEMSEGRAVNVGFRAGSDVHSESVSGLRLRVHLKGLTQRDTVTVAVNGMDLGRLATIGTPEPNGKGHWLERSLASAQVKMGDNVVRLTLTERDKSTAGNVLVDGMLLQVRHRGLPGGSRAESRFSGARCRRRNRVG
jgi:hypothetical protein